jgi:hypothetical protein
VKFKTLVSQIGKPLSVAEALADRDTKSIAAQFGISRRTAQKWKAGTQQPDKKKQGGATGVLKKLDTPTNRRKIAATVVRNAQGAAVGRIAVVDKSPRGKKAKTGFRNVGTVDFNNDRSRDRLNDAADAIERRDYDRAEQLFGEAVLGTPGKDYGSALEINDWPPGFHLF